MERKDATYFLREEMNKWGLKDWTIRLNQNPDSGFLGMCLHRDKTIVMSAHHIDIHPEPSILNTIRHEIAHALVGAGHGHDEVWAAKAREVGCDNTLPCSNLSLSPQIIDAIRSGATVEVTFDEQVIRTPKYTVTRLQDKCEVCGKVAKTLKESTVTMPDDQPDMKFITLECGHMVFKKIPKGTPFHKFQAFGDVNCSHQWDKNTCVKCDRKRPYPFQLEGMKAGEKGLAIQKGFAFFDEMGLGKTIQAGGIVYFHPEYWPCLWVVKSGLKYQTSNFIINWMDGHVPQIINKSTDWLIPGLKHYVIGYDMLVTKTKTNKKTGKTFTFGFDIKQFDRVGIKCVVLDECQQIKNVDSSRTQMVRRIVKDRKVIPLSGTPWNNRGSELFPVLNMMDPVKFHSEEGFRNRWVSTYYSGSYQKEGGIRESAYVGGSRITFKEYTGDLYVRRERKQVMPELPEINRTKLNVIFNAEQEAAYDIAVEEFVKWYEEQAANLTGMAIIAAMAKMRHLVGLAKIPATLEYVDEFVEDTDRKLVIFCEHQDVQDLLYDEMVKRYSSEMPIFKYFAEMNSAKRNEAADAFNASARCIMVASQGAAGEGLNLQTCSDCIMHERQWNPGREEQCEGRFIRIGSKATQVNAVYAHIEGLTAIDPALDGIVSRKRRQYHNWTGTEAAKWAEDGIMKELAEVIVRAHYGKKRAA